MTQKSFIQSICAANPNAIIIGSLGTISYDLKETAHDAKILIKGAMGAAVGCGLGYALSSKRQVIVFIGEGSLLMHLGSLSTVLKHKLPNLRIIILENNCYASCGGQENNFEHIKPLLEKDFEIIKVDPS